MPLLYLDENVKRDVMDLLIAPDRSIRTVRDEERLSASDSFQLIYAAEQRWTLVTCNRNDYHLLHDAWLLWSHRWGLQQAHTGILAPDQGLPTWMMAEAIERFFVSGYTLTNALYDWTARDGVWRRYHP